MDRPATPIALSIVVPTFNRPDALAACLASVARQSVPSDVAYEVLVLNDGGETTAGHVCADLAAEFGDALAYHASEHVGPGAIRNKAMALARGEVILFLNDDVTLRPGHLAAHLARHAARPGHAARGMTVWAAECNASPFMAWLTRQSFFYYLIDDFDACGYEYWHTCDLSIARERVTGANAILFNEEFPYAGFEDTEWGWRLEAAGCELAFLPDAITDHHHLYTPEGLEERGRRNGISGAILLDLVPELRDRAIGDFLEQRVVPSGSFFRRLMGKARELIAGDGEAVSERDREIRAWRKAFKESYVEGFMEEYERRHGEAFDPLK